MKRYILIVFAFIVCMCASAHTRLTPEMVHFLSFNGDLGYSAMLHNIPDHPASAGMNTNLGLGYRLFYNNFLFSTGLEAAYQLNANKMDNMDFQLTMMDTEGDQFQMHVLVDKSRDLTHMLNLNIPLLMGGEWGRFYFLIGPKISANLYGAASSKANFTTYGEYTQYYDDFYDMPNHQFESDHQMNSGTLKMNWNFNILAHLEIGGRLGSYTKNKGFRRNQEKVQMYLAAYVDFGILNIHTGKAGAPIFEYRQTEDKGLQFYIQPLMVSNLSDNAVVRNMNVGLKYTICLPYTAKAKSYIYDWRQVERDYRKRGGNQSFKNN